MSIHTGYEGITERLWAIREQRVGVFLTEFIQAAIDQELLPTDYREIVEADGAEGYYARMQMQKHFAAWNVYLQRIKHHICIKQKLYGGEVRLDFCPVRIYEKAKIDDMQYRFRKEFERRSKNLLRQPDATERDLEMTEAFHQLWLMTAEEARKISMRFREVKEIQ